MHLSLQARKDFPPRNQDYKRDIVYVTKHSKRILKLIGIWPYKLNGIAKFLPKIVNLFSNLVLFFAIIPCILHITLEEKDMIIRLKLCGLLSFCLTSVMKYWALTLRKPRIYDCLNQLQSDWMQVEFNEDRQMMLKYGRIGRNLTIICAAFMYTGGAIYHTILQYAVVTFENEHNRTIKPLVYPNYSPLYDVQKSPAYELVYFVHCLCGFVIYSVTAGACGLAALFATHACGQVDIVTSRLKRLTVNGCVMKKSKPDRRLIKIVEHHLRILRFSSSLETILQEVCFVEFVGSTFMICLLEYYCIVDWEHGNAISLTTYAMLLVSFIFNIFILCYIGELLMEKTGSIGLSCFMIDWYHLPRSTIHGLILIIAMSNNPAKISAGRITDLSLSAFGNVLKTSLAYLSFLRTAVM